MLPVINRLRTASDFSSTVRSGTRSGRRNLVLYTLVEPAGEACGISSPSKVGFIVAKTVGTAVTRNLVKRRLRAMAAPTVLQYPKGLRMVVRALPPAAESSWQELQADYDSAFRASLAKIPEHARPAIEPIEQGASE